MDTNLRHLEAFVTIARLGSFTRAADALHVSQPALTVQIRQLETAIGVRLFDRNNRRVALTRAGAELAGPFERLLLDLRAVFTHARDLSAHRRGSATVAALPSIASSLLPQAIKILTDRHAGIVVRVRDVVAGRVVELVKNGDVDFGIGSLIRPDAELACEPLFVDRLLAVAPPDHPAARRRWITLRDLSRHPLVLTSPDSSVRQLVERALEQQRLPATVAQEATYMTTAMAMARAGLGVAILPASALATPDMTGLRAVSIRRPALTRDIGLIRRNDRSYSPASATLVKVLREIESPRRRR
jgi:DNA-binding transcriptional LysR family regulator